MPLPWMGLVGPTASGKTAAALALAKRLRDGGMRLEIISVDSALVYRGMDIGTAKPSLEERASVPHHLIDVLEPSEHFSAAAFVQQAQALIQSMHARGAFPLLVGGTMLYFKALMDGLSEMPPSTPQGRAELQAELEALGLPALYARLERSDPATAARLAPGDTQRILRALEVQQSSGRPLSRFHHDEARSSAWAPWQIISLEPTGRAWLHQRIEQRLQAMVDLGFLDEVRALMARGDLHVDLPSMRCVGYRQAWAALSAAKGSGAPDDVWFSEALAATRQLAKRQLTWLRGMPSRRVLASDAVDVMAQVESIADETLANWGKPAAHVSP